MTQKTIITRLVPYVVCDSSLQGNSGKIWCSFDTKEQAENLANGFLVFSCLTNSMYFTLDPTSGITKGSPLPHIGLMKGTHRREPINWVGLFNEIEQNDVRTILDFRHESFKNYQEREIEMVSTGGTLGYMLTLNNQEVPTLGNWKKLCSWIQNIFSLTPVHIKN